MPHSRKASNSDRIARGLPGFRTKGERWSANHEVHLAIAAGPWPLDDKFIVGFKSEVTNRPSGTHDDGGDGTVFGARWQHRPGGVLLHGAEALKQGL